MNIEIFTICEYAQTVGNIINVIAPFDTISTDKLPVSKSFSIAVRLRYEPEDKSEKDILYKIYNTEGKNILANIVAKVDIIPHNEKTMCINLVLVLDNMVFNKTGKYRIAMETEGVEYEVPLYIELNQ